MKLIELSKEVQQSQIKNIKDFFLNERDEEISDFQAETLLQFILREIGPGIYNQAIADAYALMSDRLEDIYGLEKRNR